MFEKGAVLQEVRIFSANPLKPKACYSLLSRILWVMMHGESISKKEATNVFFAVTKLFQSKDVPLRRMVYVVLKELAKISDDVLIAIAILSKDMASELEPFRANSLRTIARVVDTTMLGQVERSIKQSIVDKEPYVASCALVSGIHLIHRSPEIVKKWVSEVQEAVNSRNLMVQYHALALLHQIRHNDPMAISKLVYSLAKGNVRSHLALCMLIRYACKIMGEQAAQNRDAGLFAFVESCLRYSSDMVVFEAARQIANLPNASMKEMETAVTVLQPFLTSPKPTLRYAAVKVIHKVAITHPRIIDTNACFELRNLITDTNRAISTLAVITLLQVEKEAGVGVLLREIANFVGEISDDFKVSVVDGIRTLASKYPAQHPAIMAALSSMLRAEAGFDYKRRIVDSFLDIIRDIPESKDYALAYLCEYIEDCEFTYLSTKILNLLGQEGPQSQSYAVFIRYIYNRVILEKAAVRASALTALSRFAAVQTQAVKILLEQGLHDNDDHVRDKATFFLSVIGQLSPSEQTYIRPQMRVPLDNLDAALVAYLADNSQNGDAQAFDINTVSMERQIAAPKQIGQGDKAANKSGVGAALDISNVLNASTSESSLTSTSRVQTPTPPGQMLDLFPELGALFKTSPPQALTEAETEYQVTCFRHIFPQSMSLVLQFNIINTLTDQALSNIVMDIKPTDASRLHARKVRVVRRVAHPGALFAKGKPESTMATLYIVMQYHEDLRQQAFPVQPLSFNCTMKFEALPVIDEANEEVDDSGAFQDEYPLDSLDIATADNLKRVNVANWTNAWDSMEPTPPEQEDAPQQWHQALVTFSLSIAHLQDAVQNIISTLGMQPCDGTEEVPPKRTKHILQLAGLHLSGAKVTARARMKLNSPAPGVLVELCIRSPSEIISNALANVIVAQ
jgi:coatomer protein complex subunit gamma